jgi:predicted MFS family arabinose efflux permease
MPDCAPQPSQTATPQPRLTGGLVLLFAVTCGFAVANIYYNQPMLVAMATSLGIPASAIGIVAMASQVGYACGLLFLVPLGDGLNRRHLILTQVSALVLVLLGAAAAPNLTVLALTSFGLGVFSTVAQQLIPMAASMADPAKRGSVVGNIMSGLLIGILGARVLSGAVAEFAGWRSMFLLAALFMAVLGGLLYATLPSTKPGVRLSYARLMISLKDLWLREPALREAALEGALMFASFSAFWVTLTLYLASPAFHLGSTVAGGFGLAGIAGAFAAQLAGRLSDRRGPYLVIAVSMAINIAAFIVFGLVGGTLVGLGIGVLLMDFGVQGTQIANQSRIYAASPDAPSRANTVYMVIYFIGGAAGSSLGALAWAHAGWMGVSILGGVCTLLAFAVFVRARLRSR